MHEEDDVDRGYDPRFIIREALEWQNYLYFGIQLPMFFLIAINENSPAHFNMVQGCYNGWFRFILQLFVFKNFFMRLWNSQLPFASTTDKVFAFKDGSFSLITFLELIYPMTAYCEASP
jgi:hypothetical protein